MCKLLLIACTFLLLHSHVLLSVPPPPAFRKAGVVTNTETCTNVALEVLDDDGSAVDAAIAALLCEGITNPQSMGIGGGFLMTVYDSGAQSVHVLNAREVAPAAAMPEMYTYSKKGNLTVAKEIAMGGLAVAVPGELMGYYEAHKKFGKIGWYDLFRPAIELATKGVRVTQYTAKMIEKIKDDIQASPTLMALLTNPDTSMLYRADDLMQRKTLANTLEMIAQHGPKALYSGCLTEDFLLDIRENGGIISNDDLRSYKAVWEKPVEHSIGKYILYSAGNPGSGELLMYVLDVMAGQLCNLDYQFWHRMIETWKFVFGIRASYSGGGLADEERAHGNFDPHLVEAIVSRMQSSCTSNNPNSYLPAGAADTAVEDHGTSQICIYARNGDAVSVTSTINLSFGALFVSESTGIILNNEMMDFSIPHHFHFRSGQNRANQIAPWHYPMSTMLPTIVLDPQTNKVRLIIGASGGFKILTSASIVILQNLFMNVPLRQAIAAKRLHHQLKPMVVEFEEGFDESILQNLQKLGHVLQPLDCLDSSNSSSSMATYSCVNGISIIADRIHPAGDARRSAYACGL